MYGLADDFQALRKERDEAEQLLTAICKVVNWKKENYPDEYHGIDDISEFPGMREWWDKHRPKTEREEKLEKVAAALSLGGKATPEMMPVAERVLQALGL